MLGQTLNEKCAERIRRDIPEWRNMQLEIIAARFNHSDRNLWLMQLWMNREISLCGSALLTKKACEIQDAFNLVGAFEGWSMEVRGSRHLSADFTSRYLDGTISSRSRHIVYETSGSICDTCTLLLTAPDGTQLAYLLEKTQRLQSSEGAQYYAYIRGKEAVFSTFLLEYNRIMNAIIDLHPQQPDQNRELYVHNTGKMLTISDNIGWNEIVLAPDVAAALRDDFLAFVMGESWYRHNKIPYKRGYLLCGPPGNGKTCVARAMARTPGFNAYTFDFSAKDHNENKDIMELFEFAADNAPSIVILEDLDRVFADIGKTNVTLDCLFNCIDGVTGTDGIVIVATANHLEWIDSAIRNRPGRFDRVVTFSLPTRTERRLYLDQLFGNSADSLVSGVTLERIVTESESFAMAHLKELFVSAGNQCVIAGKEKIEDSDALEAFGKIRDQFTQTREFKAGFGGHRQAAGF